MLNHVSNNTLRAAFACFALFSVINAQSGGTYTITQSVVANGGSTASSGGQFTVAGTIGQSVAGQPSNGGTFGTYAGFWSPPPLGPSAAGVTVSGRVQTANGSGIRGVLVKLTNATGIAQTAITGSFGYFRFDEVTVGETYVISVSAKRFEFAQPSQILTIDDARDDVFFNAMEP